MQIFKNFSVPTKATSRNPATVGLRRTVARQFQDEANFDRFVVNNQASANLWQNPGRWSLIKWKKRRQLPPLAC